MVILTRCIFLQSLLNKKIFKKFIEHFFKTYSFNLYQKSKNLKLGDDVFKGDQLHQMHLVGNPCLETIDMTRT